MATYSRVTYTGTGSAFNASFSFPYLNQSDIYVYVNGVSVPFTFLNTSTVTPTAIPAAGAVVQVRRDTQKITSPVNFTDGSVILEKDLDLLSTYSLYLAQEASDAVTTSITLNTSNLFDAQGSRLVNVANPVDLTDAVNRQYFESVYTPLLDAKVTSVASSATTATTQAGIAATQAAASAASAALSIANSANVTTVAGIASNVTTVAGISANVTAVANNATNVNAAVANAANINSAVSNATNINAAVTNATNINAVNANSSNINTAVANLAVLTGKVSQTSATGSAQLPTGTQAQRDASPIAGSLRFNSDVNKPEVYNGTSWGSVGGGATGFGFENRIINGAMVIDQRNAGASVTPTADSTYTLDRWLARLSQASKFSVQQNAGAVTLPTGFTNYLGATSLSAYSIGASDYFNIQQRIEGFNVADLGWGTAAAATITISFRVYSSLTGTFGGTLLNDSGNRSYPFSYSIPVANTWTTVSITIAGDTTGTWLKTNGNGLTLFFSIGTGSTLSGTAGAWSSSTYLSATGAVSVVGTSGATFYITGVQLEKGSTATSFDYRDYGRELIMCQRYFWKTLNATGIEGVALPGVSINYGNVLKFPVTMRTTPTVTSAGFVDSGNMNGNSFSDNNPDWVMARGSTFSGVVSASKAAGYYQASITVSAEL